MSSSISFSVLPGWMMPARSMASNIALPRASAASRPLRISESEVTVRRSMMPTLAAYRRYEKEVRTLPLIQQRWLRRGLRVGRSPFLDMRQCQSMTDQHIQICRHAAVLFDDAFAQPVDITRAVFQIMVHRPD